MVTYAEHNLVSSRLLGYDEMYRALVSDIKMLSWLQVSQMIPSKRGKVASIFMHLPPVSLYGMSSPVFYLPGVSTPPECPSCFCMWSYIKLQISLWPLSLCLFLACLTFLCEPALDRDLAFIFVGILIFCLFVFSFVAPPKALFPYNATNMLVTDATVHSQRSYCHGHLFCKPD